MPSLPWLLNWIQEAQDINYRNRLHDATAVFSVLTLWLILRLYVPARGYAGSTLTDKLIGIVTAGMLVANLAFVVMGDRYTIVYLPLGLWVIGRTAGPWGRATRVIVLAGALAALSWSLRWTWGRLEPLTTHFLLAETALARGAQPFDVSTDWQWLGYHGGFDDWMASVRGRDDVSLNEYFPFSSKRALGARYVVTDSRPGKDVVVVAERKWRDQNGREHKSFLIDRSPSEPHN